MPPIGGKGAVIHMILNLLEYLEQTVQRFPSKVAFPDGQRKMTFLDIYTKARALGSHLASLGLYREPVAVCMKKGPDAITAFLGVLYSGCFYVPMDTDMPRGRAEAILSSLLPRAAVYDAQSEKLLLHSDDGMDILRIPYGTASESLCDAESLERIRRSHIDTDPAYIVYTSGSTGAPKGVCACHRSVIDYIEQLSELLCVNENTVFGNQAPLFTDACLKEIYTVLKHGASAFLIPRMLFSFPVRLVEFLNANKINTICWVSSALTLVSSLGTFEKAKPEFLATIAFGSEVFPARQLDLWRKCLPDARFINLYGPTEATGMSCFYEIDREFAPEEPIPIGCPFPNTEILLLCGNRPALPGEEGEICIRGTALALGYYGSFEKTEDVFVQNPLNDRYPERIYRTGDIGKYNERGELVFVSRRDGQIKHMGYRIELSEIEAAASLCEGVFLCCCLYDSSYKQILLIYTGQSDEAVLFAHLKNRLPRYMLPAALYRIGEMPLTVNGKIDRALLRQDYLASPSGVNGGNRLFKTSEK